ncbi:FliM/FliN family flagellar motor C-terminal domain-containing protein [Jhaorihella thermophila]
MERNFGAIRAELTAVIERLRLPLAQLARMQPGELLPLARGRLNQTELVALDGRVIATGKLGQAGGLRAIRLRLAPGGRGGGAAGSPRAFRRTSRPGRGRAADARAGRNRTRARARAAGARRRRRLPRPPVADDPRSGAGRNLLAGGIAGGGFRAREDRDGRCVVTPGTAAVSDGIQRDLLKQRQIAVQIVPGGAGRCHDVPRRCAGRSAPSPRSPRTACRTGNRPEPFRRRSGPVRGAKPRFRA